MLALVLALAADLAAAAPGKTGAPSPAELRRAGAPGLASIRPEALSAHVRFLADDLLEGRLTGSRGHAIAERYVASVFQAAGLEPAGAAGSWFQPVPLRAARKDPSRTSFAVAGGGHPEEPLLLDQDYYLSSDGRTADVDVSAPLVFVGFGVSAPEYRYDDLAGVDVRGKIAVVLRGAPLSDRPDFFPPIAHAVYSDTREKVRRLGRRGAVGMLSVIAPDEEEQLTWKESVKQSHDERMDWLEGDAPGSSPAGVIVRGALEAGAFERILERAGVAGGLAAIRQPLEAGAHRPSDLAVTAHVRLAAVFRDFTSNNVVGVLRGRDPRLSAEYVVYSAHLDHLGIGEPVDGDAIYNGALDNASGVACILEIARAFSALPARPARSLLFIATTGEEPGFLGSEYFVRHPTVPPGSAVADLNVDGVLAFRPLHDVVAFGEEYSTLGADVRAGAQALGLAVSPDPQPKQVLFIRSDQYRFVQQGIPSLFLWVGAKDEHGRTDENLARSKDWFATRYHSPKDEWDPAYDWEAMAQIARVGFLSGLSIARRPERPRWKPGDFFARYPEPGG